jgi:hypothetical protein
MKDEEIDLTDSPELDATFFQEAVPWPTHKKQITMRLDPGFGLLQSSGEGLPDGYKQGSAPIC